MGGWEPCASTLHPETREAPAHRRQGPRPGNLSVLCEQGPRPPLQPWCLLFVAPGTNSRPRRGARRGRARVMGIVKVDTGRNKRWRRVEVAGRRAPRLVLQWRRISLCREGFTGSMEVPAVGACGRPTIASLGASVFRHLFPSRGLRPRILPHSSIAWLSLSPILGHEPGITYHELRYLLL